MTPTATIARTDPSTIVRRPVSAGLDVSIARTPKAAPFGDIAEADLMQPRHVRRSVRAVLRHWVLQNVVETAELLATELVTNALQHGCGPDIGFRLYLSSGGLVIEVRDGSQDRPVLRCAAPYDEDGRGLTLVDALADSWGVSPDGTTTWCKIPISEGSSEMEPIAITAVASTLPERRKRS